MMLLRPSVWLSLSYEAHSSVILIYCCLSLQSTQPEWDTLHCSLSTLLVCAVYTVWDTALFSLHTACLCSLHRVWDSTVLSPHCLSVQSTQTVRHSTVLSPHCLSVQSPQTVRHSTVLSPHCLTVKSTQAESDCETHSIISLPTTYYTECEKQCFFLPHCLSVQCVQTEYGTHSTLLPTACLLVYTNWV